MVGWPRFGARITHSPYFAAQCDKAFKEADTDGDGALSLAELTVATLRLYDSLNRKLPCRLRVPTTLAMKETLEKFDRDSSGKLNYPEFLEFAQALVGAKGKFTDSLLFKGSVVVGLKLVVFPLAAWGIKELFKVCGVSKKLVDPVPSRALTLSMESVAKATLPVPL